MENRDDLNKRLAAQMASDAMRIKDPNAQMRLYATGLAILAFVGEEAVQVIFRKNFGRNGLNTLRLILCFVLFEFIALISFVVGLSSESEPPAIIGSKSSFILTGFFYTVLGLFVLIKGFIAKREGDKSKRPERFAGESNLLSFLGKEEGWSQTKIQTTAEPVLVLAIGLFLLTINFVWGLPLIYCALSVWICHVIEQIFLAPLQDAQNQHKPQNRNFPDVN